MISTVHEIDIIRELGILLARALVYLGHGMTFLALVRDPGSDYAPGALPTLPECYAAIGASTDDGRWRLAAANFAGYYAPIGAL